ncbi:hypothetical protein BS47DRAFT_1146599 [Hydnum rufescens UP504]|uniref:Uncharacterized protein n=1 Tax=Hydnum rufescens UP504 TaxID=1448309 RepID=A0A9P6ATN1_9AGAM|nr:hypothetical protein BS47DRAFT_1146599 [Hydnum rufescens UP504]
MEPITIPPSETAVDSIRRHGSIRNNDRSPSETTLGELQRHLHLMREVSDRQFSQSSWDSRSSSMSFNPEDPPGYNPMSDEFRREMERERMRLRERRRLRDLAGEVSRVATGVDRIMNYMGRAGRESDVVQEHEHERRASAPSTGPQSQHRSSGEAGRRGRIVIDEVHPHDSTSASRRDRRSSNRSPPPLRSPSSSIAFETVMGRHAPGAQPRPNSPSPSPATRLANRLRRSRPPPSGISDASVDDWLASWPANTRHSTAERGYVFGPRDADGW